MQWVEREERRFLKFLRSSGQPRKRSISEPLPKISGRREQKYDKNEGERWKEKHRKKTGKMKEKKQGRESGNDRASRDRESKRVGGQVRAGRYG